MELFVLVAILAAFVIGGVVGLLFGGSGKKQPKLKPHHYLVVYDGELIRCQECDPDVGGVSLVGDGDVTREEYLLPEGAILQTLKLDALTTLHLAGIERVALKQHEQLDVYRQAVLSRSVPAFKPGGDGAGLLRLAGTVLPAVVLLWLAFQVIGMQSNQVELTAQLNQLNDLLQHGVRLAE